MRSGFKWIMWVLGGCLPALLCAQSWQTEAHLLREQKAFEARLRPAGPSATNNYDIIYTRFEWQIDPAVNYIAGAVTPWFKPQSPTFNSIEFDLSSVLTVDSIKYHNAKLSFLHGSNHILTASLPATLPQGQQDSLTIFYRGAPAGSGLGSFAQSTHSNSPAVWTLSEPYGARDWWPCKQNLADKIDSIDVIVSCPNGNRVASNGLLLSETNNGNTASFHWKSRYPIAAYLVAIAVTNYAVFTQTLTVPSGTLPIVNYMYPEYLASAQEEAKGILDIMKLYDSLLIPYPFSKEKYGHAQFGWGGGMEHQTMSFMYGLDFSLMAHECAHHWFGDHVTCGTWQDVWLNEGFATYLEGLCVQRYFGGERWLDWRTSKIRDVTSQPNGSVFCTDTTTTGRIFNQRLSYFKGAYVLRMLRWKIGDQAFFKGLKEYLTNPRTAGKFGRTDFLRQHLEQASGMDLGGFLSQWYYGQGYPSYDVVWKQSGHELSVTINQQSSHPSVPFFQMPVPIEFAGLERDTVLVFDHRFAGQQFTCTVPFDIRLATFDPELQLLSKNNHISAIFDLDRTLPAMEVFPNPVHDFVQLRLQRDAERITSVDIYDALGQRVMAVNSPLSLSDVEISVSALSTGVYVLDVKTARGRYYSRFIKL